MDNLDQNFQKETKIFCKFSEKYGSGPKCFGARIEIFGSVYILCCTKNPVTHTHTQRVQTLLSHSDKSQKQTKTQTTQQGSHRQKSPRPEVIRCYSNEKTPRNRSIMVDTCKLQVHVGVHLYFQEFGFSFFGYSIRTAWTKIFRERPIFFCKCSEKYGHGQKNFGASIEIFELVYNTMLHQNPVTHTHTHTHCECKHFSLTEISLQNRQKLKLLNKDLIVRSLPGQK